MENFNPKQKSEGLGDTIAKITSATGLDKVAEALAKAAGKEDCGCNRRREALNKFIPYEKPKIQTTPLDEIVGNYEVLQDIYCTLPEIGNTVLNKGTILTIGKNHPLYDDVKFYYKNNIIKKL